MASMEVAPRGQEEGIWFMAVAVVVNVNTTGVAVVLTVAVAGLNWHVMGPVEVQAKVAAVAKLTLPVTDRFTMAVVWPLAMVAAAGFGVIVMAGEEIVVTSLAESLAVLTSPPPDTVAVLVTEAGAFAATSTVRVIAG